MADDNMIGETSQPTENGKEEQSPDVMEDEEDDIDDDDFDSLNLQLDELSSALDALEQKNDHIHAQLMKLLESNRETRQQFQENIAREQNSNPQV
ncbi:bublin coiled-coil protein [Periplaneta americana]|uniref:bublin coiled-coil protein n=1 Tax=Periplaneta americana TaxID=6978 RepID=UPI0037E849D2